MYKWAHRCTHARRHARGGAGKQPGGQPSGKGCDGGLWGGGRAHCAGARARSRVSWAQPSVWSSLTGSGPRAIICQASADLPAPDGPRISNPRPSMATQLACKRRSGPTGPVTPADPPQNEPRAVRMSGRHSWGECSRPRSPRHGPRQFASRSTDQGPNCCRDGWQADRNRTA